MTDWKLEYLNRETLGSWTVEICQECKTMWVRSLDVDDLPIRIFHFFGIVGDSCL